MPSRLHIWRSDSYERFIFLAMYFEWMDPAISLTDATSDASHGLPWLIWLGRSLYSPLRLYIPIKLLLADSVHFIELFNQVGVITNSSLGSGVCGLQFC